MRAPVAFVTTSLPALERHGDPRIGRLFTPRMLGRVDDTAARVIWAADNDCFNGLDRFAYDSMLANLYSAGSPAFVTVPDVVADAERTRARFDKWIDRVESYCHPAAYVLQDGEDGSSVPWDRIAAVFVGGSTEYKLGEQAADVVMQAKARGLWAHMGRVNTRGRYRYAAAIGIDSIDGSSFGRMPAKRLPELSAWMDELEAEEVAA